MTDGAPATDVDVAVIGGGGPGATVATLLAQGMRVAVFGGERFARFHIGESHDPRNLFAARAAQHAAEDAAQPFRQQVQRPVRQRCRKAVGAVLFPGVYDRGADRMRRLVCEYYDGFSFGRFVRTSPHLRGTVTDLLIGDLFTNKVDQVWSPMESLYPDGKAPIPAWNDAPPTSDDIDQPRVRELSLPEGRTP